MQSAQSNPLDIPEIRLALSAYLNKTDLAVSCLVCKSWSRTFRPFLISSLYLTDNAISFGTLNCTFLSDIVEIYIDPSSSHVLLNSTFPNLASLIVFPSTDTHSSSLLFESFATFIQRHHASLNSLDLADLYTYPLDLWSNLAEPLLFPKLKELMMGNPEEEDWISPGEFADSFWKACARVSSLFLTNINVLEFSCPIFNHLESLNLYGLMGLTIPQCMLWFANCPRLQSLSWTVLKDEFGPIAKAGEQIVEGISSLALAGHLQRLHSVKLDFKSFMTPVDSLPLTLSFTKLLTSLKAPLQVLEIEYAQNMDATIFLPVLQCHFSTLRGLNINIDSSHTVQMLLTSCPLLEEFKGSKVRALDMMSGAPWSCLGLQHLQLMIELDPEMEDQPGMTKDDQQVFALRQISQLARLNRLDFSGRLSYGEENLSRFSRSTLERYQQGNNLNLRLSKGLDLLCTLSRLQYVTLPCGQIWDDQEFDWALLHWPNLSNIWETVIPEWRLLPIPDRSTLDGFEAKVAEFRTVIQNK